MGGTDFSKNYTHRSWHLSCLYPLEGSGGMLPREIVKIRASNDSFYTIFRLKYDRILDPERGGGATAAPPSGSATPPPPLALWV